MIYLENTKKAQGNIYIPKENGKTKVQIGWRIKDV